MHQLFSFFYQDKRRALFHAIFWTLHIFLACLLPGQEVPNISIPFIDKWVHFAIFGGFAFLWLCYLKSANLLKGFGVALISILVGFLVELLQGSGITSGRSFEYLDVVADGIGGIIGIVVFFLMRHFFYKGERSNLTLRKKT